MRPTCVNRDEHCRSGAGETWLTAPQPPVLLANTVGHPLYLILTCPTTLQPTGPPLTTSRSFHLLSPPPPPHLLQRFRNMVSRFEEACRASVCCLSFASICSSVSRSVREGAGPGVTAAATLVGVGALLSIPSLILR